MATEIEIFSVLAEGWNHFNARPLTTYEQRSMESYARHLERFEAEVLREAMEIHIGGAQFFPTVHELVSQAGKLMRRRKEASQWTPPKDPSPEEKAKMTRGKLFLNLVLSNMDQMNSADTPPERKRQLRETLTEGKVLSEQGIRLDFNTVKEVGTL